MDDSRHSYAHPDGGFTVVELMLVVLILATLITIAIPVFSASKAKAQSQSCLATRTAVELADYGYYLANGTWSATISDLVGSYLKSAPVCPAGGTYAWLDTPTADKPCRSLACSVHFAPTTPASPLGYSFNEISTNFISLMAKYKAANGSYARTWAPYNFTDLGLNPADWATAYGHIKYSPSGSVLNLTPDAGYSLQVNKSNGGGAQMTLTPDLKWSLVYNAADGKWYYHTISPGNQVDISTLVVVPSN